MIVLYDSDCGFCRWVMAWVVRRDRRQVLVPAPIQSATGDELLADVAPSDRMLTAHVVRNDGSRRSGGAAVAEVLCALGQTGVLGRLARRLPQTTELAYRAVAARRKTFGKLVGERARQRADRVLRAREASAAEPDRRGRPRAEGVR
jgi:predicted DCC family thiol-disulfide oxidoreductase YuxK